MLKALKKYIARRTARGMASAHTARAYLTHARLYLDWCAERGVDPRFATEETILDYRADLVRRYAPSTVALKLQAVRVLYEARPGANPAINVAPPRDLTPSEETVTSLSVDQVQAVLSGIEAQSDRARRARDRAMARLLVALGLRNQELCRLDLADLVLDDPTPRLVVRGKGRRRRTLYLTDWLIEALRGWLAVRPATDDPALFVSTTRVKQLSTNGVRKIVRGWLDAAGVEARGHTVHVFRHTAITLAVLAGARPSLVQRMAGHSDPRTTDIYVHIVDARENNPALAVESMLM